MLDLIWDALLQKQVGDLGKRNSEVSESVSEARTKVLSLEQRYERLRLLTFAMWSLVHRPGGVPPMSSTNPGKRNCVRVLRREDAQRRNILCDLILVRLC